MGDASAGTDIYAAERAAYIACLDREATGCLTVVFAPGKTGSTALGEALKRVGVPRVFRIHNLGLRMSARYESRYRERAPGVFPRHIWEAQWLAAHRPSPERRWQVVTCVHEPIERLVSAYFQQNDRFGSTAVNPEQIAEELFSAPGPLGLDWFDFQFGRHLGIDVYAYPFDPARGYGIIEHDHADVLLLRRESLDQAPRALRDFFGFDADVPVRPENVSRGKDYQDAYRAALDLVRVPDEMVETVCASRLVQHFYSAEERRELRRRWTRPVGQGR